jgi:hypothetical protein
MTEPWTGFYFKSDEEIRRDPGKHLPLFLPENERTRYVIAKSVPGFANVFFTAPDVPHVTIQAATADYLYRWLWGHSGIGAPDLPDDWKKDYPEETFTLDQNVDKIVPLLRYPYTRLKNITFKQNPDQTIPLEKLGAKLGIALKEGYHPNLDYLLTQFNRLFWGAFAFEFVLKGLYEEVYLGAPRFDELAIEWLALYDPLATLILSDKFLPKLPGLYQFLDRYIKEDGDEIMRPLLTNIAPLNKEIFDEAWISGWQRDLIEEYRSDLLGPGHGSDS